MTKSLSYFLVLLIFASCSDPDNLTTVSVSETAGLDRPFEYVSTSILTNRKLAEDEIMVLTNSENGSSNVVQELKLIENGDQFKYDILFPLEIFAGQTKHFEVSIQEKMRSSHPVQLMLSEDKLSVENQFYKIHFSSEDDKRGGQINGIELKDFENQLLNRGHISMHWAPNYSKSDSDSYFNMEDFPSNSENFIHREMFTIVKKRSGVADSVPEISINGRYEFFTDLPYFFFESTITMEKDVELDLLRNDEMTMDSLFTHVVYPKKDGTIKHLELYDQLDSLVEHPITDDADWVAFYNLGNGYGFGSIRLKYDNSNVNGKPSPTYKPYTKISRATGNGRYWNRVLSDTVQTFPKGSRYYEKNAYLLFSVDSQSPEKEIIHYSDCLKNPLKVEVRYNFK